jgi:very-short-patch-repair endonuclease
MSLRKVGKPFTQSHKNKISKSLTLHPPMLGKHHSDEMKKKQSERNLGRKLSTETKKRLKNASILCWENPTIRKKYYDALAKTKWINVRTDVGQLELIEKWNRLGFNFEPNFQLKTDDFLYYLDGYDKEKNVVLEYDGKYHSRQSQKKQDQIRQQNIIDILKPKKFWRYNKKFNSFSCY